MDCAYTPEEERADAIVHVVGMGVAVMGAARAAGDFVRLGHYVVDSAHAGEKVAWSRVTNCGTDHQRLSALHVTTDHAHLHVALNRVHPETYKCADPSFGQCWRMRACHELEIALGVTRTHHGLGRDDASLAPIKGKAADMQALKFTTDAVSSHVYVLCKSIA